MRPRSPGAACYWAEKQEVLADFHRGTLSAEAYDALLGTIDARLATLDAGEPAPNDRTGETPPEIEPG